MHALRFSIIIPTYNYERHLPRAVDSVLADSGSDYEIVVVDDGSTDATPEVMGRYGVPVRYVRQENQGPSAARNHGVHVARGEWLLPLDSDDALLPDALERFRSAIDTHADSDVLAGGFVAVSGDGRRRERPAPVLAASREANFLNYLEKRISIGYHGTFIARREVLTRYAYPENFRNYEHIVLVAWLLANCRWQTFPEPVAEIVSHPGQLRSEEADSTGTLVADTLFDPQQLPFEFLAYRARFLSQHLLSRFRTSFRRGQYSEANEYYRHAIRLAPWNLAKVNYLTKYLRSRCHTLRSA